MEKKIKYSSKKKFEGSAPSDFYNEGYYLRAEGSNYGRRDKDGKELFLAYDERVLGAHRSVVAKLLNQFKNIKSVIVLGCARGYMVKALHERGVYAVGIDISEWAIENCAEGIEDYVYCGDVCDLSLWGDEAFDVAVAFDVFEHIRVPDLYQALDEACRVARMVFLDVPINVDDEHPDQSSGTDKTHVSVYSKEWWIREFMARGFEPFYSQEYFYPEIKEESPWPDKKDHAVTIFFSKPTPVPTSANISPVLIAPDSKQFKILWWSNAPTAPCFDVHTEVLTRRGWVFFKDLQMNDEVATYNEDNNLIEYHKPYAVINEPYDGLMYHHESIHLSIVCTPNHRLYVRTEPNQPFRLREARDVVKYYEVEHFCGGAGWKGASKESMVFEEIEKRNNSVKHIGVVNSKKYVEFLGWYIAEGSYTRGSKGEYIVQLALNKKEADKVYELCRETFPMLSWFKIEEEHKVNIRTYSIELYKTLEPLGRSHEKHIPADIKNLDREHLEILL